jgi:hypothetical protein
LLSYLLCKDDKLVMASLCLLVSFLQNEALDEALLDALGILPRRKRHKKLLLVCACTREGPCFMWNQLLILPRVGISCCI